MTDYESHYENDDELLSAYLDEELSPEVRAAVEARLTNDPAAREMLHQLRAVSQAVQGLPQEALGEDLRDPVLQRVARAGSSPAAATGAAAVENPSSRDESKALADSAPIFTIGRTKRAWVWASLAIAAALAIMAIQSDPNREQRLPAVAKRDNRPATREPGPRDLETRPLNEDLAMAPEAMAPAAPAREAREFAEAPAGRPASGPRDQPAGDIATATAPRDPSNQPADERRTDLRSYANSAARAAPTSQAAVEASPSRAAEMSSVDQLSAAAPPAAVPGMQSGSGLDDASGLSDAPAGLEPAASADEQEAEPLVVVRVLAKRTALRSKAFDRLLEQSGIDVAPSENDSSAPGRPAVSTRRRVEQETLDHADERTADDEQEADVDALLVEASPAEIVAFLDSLHKDSENYLEVMVDDTAAMDETAAVDGGVTADRSPDSKMAAKKKLAAELGLGKFSRGIEPGQQQSLMREEDPGFRVETKFFAGGGFGGHAGAAGQLEQVKQQELSQARKTLSESSQARAVRLHAWGVEPQQSGEPSDRGGEAARGPLPALSRKPGQLQRQLSPAPADDDTLQVLFVLHPADAAAASPAASNRAE